MASQPFVWKNSLKLTWKDFPAKHHPVLNAYNARGKLGIALADLTLGAGTAYIWNRDLVGYAASLTKIAAMYAAFQLQASLKRVPDAGKMTVTALREQLVKEWKPEMQRLLGSAVKNDFPNLDKIFKSNASTKKLDPAFSFTGDFNQNMKDMIGPSKNDAAAYCIRAIGFDYLGASLIHGGFYDPGKGRGLWLSGDFVGGFQPGVDGKEAPGVTTIAEPSQRYQVATAEAITLFLANLSDETLIDQEASIKMKRLMTSSFAADSLGMNNKVIGKVGIQPNSVSYDDCAIVERGCLRYAMTVLFMPGGVYENIFTDLDTIAAELFAGSHGACKTVVSVIKAFS